MHVHQIYYLSTRYSIKTQGNSIICNMDIYLNVQCTVNNCTFTKLILDFNKILDMKIPH